MAPISKINSRDSSQLPLVDIIIPYYNGFDYLQESISSVLNQTFTNFRLLVIDNGTGDPRTAKYIEKLKDPRIEYVSNSSNIGIAKNFEKSRLAISSKWGVILGHDDLLLPKYLEEMLSAAEDFPTAGIIQPIVEVINDKGEVIRTTVDIVKGFIRSSTIILAKSWKHNFSSNQAILVSPALALKAIMVGDFLYFPTLMWKNTYLSKHQFRQDLEITLDIELIVGLLQIGAELLLVEKPLARYRRHDASKSGVPERKIHRLSEETALYKEFTRTLNGGKILSLLAFLRVSTRLHAILECLKAIIQLRFFNATKFFTLALK
jgi:glycosyltransferase involved in cell wall biosynthesis